LKNASKREGYQDRGSLKEAEEEEAEEGNIPYRHDSPDDRPCDSMGTVVKRPFTIISLNIVI
jgi:hypothetical protein